MIKTHKTKKFNIVYADPPWPSITIKTGYRSPITPKYKRMSMKEILEYPVREITHSNCVLFIWVISSFLDKAFFVINSWGFKYKRIDSVWIKKRKSGKKHGVSGFWGMNDIEILLMGVKGKIASYQTGTQNLYTAVEAVQEKGHSSKPQIFRDRIVYRFGNIVPKIELFAREKIDGWDAQGDEL